MKGVYRSDGRVVMNFDECEYCSKDGDRYLLGEDELWCVCKSCKDEMFKRELASGEVKVISKKEYATQYLKEELQNGGDAATVPTFESVDVLRRAHNNKALDKADYANIRTYVLKRGKDARTVKKDLTELIRSRDEVEPEEAVRRKKHVLIKRFLSTLKSIKIEMRAQKIITGDVEKDADKLIRKFESLL